MKIWIFFLIMFIVTFWYLISKIWSPNATIENQMEQDSYVFPTPKINTTDPFASPASSFSLP